MIPIHRRLALQTYKVTNLLSVAVSTVIALKSQQILSLGWAGFAPILQERFAIWQVFVFLLYLVAWHYCFSIMDLYKYHRKLFSADIFFDQFFATSFGLIMCVPLLYIVLGSKANPVLYYVFIWGVTFILSTLGRIIPWLFFRRIHLGSVEHHNLAIVGYNTRAEKFLARTCSNDELGYKLNAVFDSDPSRTKDLVGEESLYVGVIEDLSNYLRKNVIDHVAIFLPLKSQYDKAAWVVRRCQEHGITVLFPSSIFDVRQPNRLEAGQGDLRDLMVTFQYSESESLGWRYTIKYTLDFILAFFGLLLLLPLFILIAAGIRLTSSGSVLFKQSRIGLHGRRFKMYKFRTMVENAEQQLSTIAHLNEMDGPVFKIKDDPRITRFGRFLRRWSLDELPQLFNVLRGEMSLVGPRAMSVRDFEELYDDIYRRRFSVRPGLTCIWQISGRSTLSFQQWMELDLQYIDNWSLMRDLTILLQTLPAVLKGTGAH